MLERSARAASSTYGSSLTVGAVALESERSEGPAIDTCGSIADADEGETDTDDPGNGSGIEPTLEPAAAAATTAALIGSGELPVLLLALFALRPVLTVTFAFVLFVFRLALVAVVLFVLPESRFKFKFELAPIFMLLLLLLLLLSLLAPAALNAILFAFVFVFVLNLCAALIVEFNSVPPPSPGRTSSWFMQNRDQQQPDCARGGFPRPNS